MPDSACDEMTSGNMFAPWKNAFLTVCFLASAASSNAQVNPDAAQIEARCRRQTNVPQSDIDNYQNMELPQTREGKCYGACVLKAVNMMNSRGKINEKKIEEIASSQAQDENDLRRVDSKIQTCSRRANRERDECGTAYAFNRCLVGAARERTISVTLRPQINLSPPPLSFTLLSLSLLG